MKIYLLRMLAILAILSASMVGTVSAQATFDEATTALIEKARAEGPLPVIVELSTIAAQDTVINEIDGLDASVNIQYDLFPLLALSAGPDALTALASSEWVVSINEDIPQPPSLAATLPVINGDDVQTLGWDGSGQTVAILDTGIDVDHPFFAGRIVSQACFSNNAGAAGEQTLCPNGMNADTGANAADAKDNDCDPTAANLCDHGSHVAGIAAGATNGTAGEPGNGVAPGANIIAIQVFTRINTAATCTTAGQTAPCVLTFAGDQILGLQRVLALNATFTIAATNMSLGGGNNAAACDGDARKVAIDALLTAGIATVISSGNNNFAAAVGAPGCISTAVTVGGTNDVDGLYSLSNRGPLLDLFAPGCRVDGLGNEFGITSSIVDDVFGGKCGTSMSAPHVAGAFAILREAYPTATIATLLGYMTSTGVPINYDTNGDSTNDQTTPRLDLLAALQAGNNPPTLTATNASVTVDEGQTANNTGTFSDPESNPVMLSASVGAVSDSGGGNWSWSFGATDGPTQSQTVTITATDDKGEAGTVTFDLVVKNVDPVVTLDPANTALHQGETFTGSGSFTDPGADTWTGSVDYGDSTPVEALTLNPDKTFSLSHLYAQAGMFTLDACVLDDDGGKGCDDLAIIVEAYAIFAGRNDCGKASGQALSLSGSVSTEYGDVHSNSGMSVGGAAHTVDGDATYRCTAKVSGSGNTFNSGPTKVIDSRPWPVTLEASAFSCDVSVAGKLDLSNDGVWWVGGNKNSKQLESLTLCANEIKLGESGVTGEVTLVARKIELSGSKLQLTAHEHGVLALATGSGNDVIKVSGSNSTLTGDLVARSGQISLSGSMVHVNGSVIGWTINLSGSNWTIDPR